MPSGAHTPSRAFPGHTSLISFSLWHRQTKFSTFAGIHARETSCPNSIDWPSKSKSNSVKHWQAMARGTFRLRTRHLGSTCWRERRGPRISSVFRNAFFCRACGLRLNAQMHRIRQSTKNDQAAANHLLPFFTRRRRCAAACCGYCDEVRNIPPPFSFVAPANNIVMAADRRIAI